MNKDWTKECFHCGSQDSLRLTVETIHSGRKGIMESGKVKYEDEVGGTVKQRKMLCSICRSREGIFVVEED